MSLGQWLDAAHEAVDRSATLIETDGVPATDLLAVLYARDRAYSQLGRLAGLLRGSEFPPNSIGQALRDVEDPGLSPLRRFAVGVHGAMIRFARQPDYRPPAVGDAARQLVAAADHLRTAGDLLATHIEWVPYQPGGRSGLRRLTFQGHAIVTGVERDAAVGELARVALSMMSVDHALAVVRTDVIEPYVGDHVRSDLQRFATSRYREVFAAYAPAGPTVLVRTLQPAAILERSTGPRVVNTMRDVVETAAAVSAAIRESRNSVTVSLLDAVARLGFASTVAASNAAGERGQPSEQASARALRWKELAQALGVVRDLRDDISPELAIEVRRSAAWLRDQVRTEGEMTSSTWVADLAEVDSSLGWICRQAVDPLRRALIDRHLLTAVTVLGGARGSVRLAEKVWELAVPTDRDVHAVLHSLEDLGEGAEPWTVAAAVQKAYPRTTQRALTIGTRPTGRAEQGSHRRQQAPAREEPSR